MPRLSAFLKEAGPAVLAAWEVEARRLAPAQRLDRVRLRDDLPNLLRAIAGRAMHAHPLLESLQGYATAHAFERLDHGYDLGEVVTEYAMLRRVLMRAFEPLAGQLEPGASEVIQTSLDEAIRESVVRYTAARERTLTGLERISAAALETRSEDLLPALLTVMKETSESVDTLSVLLKEGDRLVTRAVRGLDEESPDFSIRIGDGFVGGIAASGKPRHLSPASTHPDVRSEVLRRSGVRALYGVPLVHQGELIGVAHMGSLTAHQFSDEDMLLFRAMTHRATALVVQAEWARRERRARADAEAALLLLDTALGTSPTGIAFLDRDLRYVRVNEALARFNGVPVEQTLGRHVTEVLGDQGRRLVPLLQRCLTQDATPVELELQKESPKGEVRSYLATFHPVRPPGGEPIGIGGVIVDITDRQRAEQALQQSDHRFRMALKGSRVVVFEQDAQLRYRWVYNSQLGLAESAVGHTDPELFAPGPDLEKQLAFKRRVLGEGAAGREEIVARLSSGAFRHYVMELEPIRDPSGAITGLFGAASDITDRKLAEEELERAANFREQFIGVLGHDLRNPLNAIKASTHLLLKHGNINEAQGRAVRRISSSGDKMARMISDILDFARGRLGGGIPIEREEVNLADLAAHVVEELHLANPERQLLFEHRGDVTGCWDADRVSQLMGNLVGNALQHGAEDRPVKISLRRAGDEVELCVHNEGKVLDPDAQRGLFEPFHGASQRQGSGGLGLGLYIVNLIVQAHGGRVEVLSSEEKGTTFRVILPRGCGKPEQPVVH